MAKARFKSETQDHVKLGKFKTCDPEYFTDKQIKLNEELKNTIKNHQCLDMDSVKDLQLSSGQDNSNERVSFSFDIIKCDRSKDVSCKSRTEIDKMLKYVKFEFYQTNEKADIMNTKKEGRG